MTSITLPQAQALIARGIQHIRDQHAKDVCLSVCDAQGFLVCFARMDAAPLRSIEIAQRKAYTSVRVGLTTTAFHAKLKQADLQIGYYGDTHLTAMAGGAVITDALGATLGGVGVSGLMPHEDQAIADELARLAGKQ